VIEIKRIAVNPATICTLNTAPKKDIGDKMGKG